MATAEGIPENPQLRNQRRKDLTELLTEVGLAVEYWLPKLQEHLGVTCAQALQNLKENDLRNLKSETRYAWEKRALERLLPLSHGNSSQELLEHSEEGIKERQRQAEQTLQELRELVSEGKQRKEEAVRMKEDALRKAIEIPGEHWSKPEVPLKEVTENLQRHLPDTSQMLTHRQNLSATDLVRWASGGLALQGIYKTGQQKDLIKRREELLMVPKGFLLGRPEQGTRMETKEFTSSQAESLFSKKIEKLGFSITMSAKGEHLGFNLEAGMEKMEHSEPKETHQSNSANSYFCCIKFSYIPLAACHFPIDQLQFSSTALQELKSMDDILEHADGPDRYALLRHRIDNFFQRFGSHANQGPLHLGGIYCWKAISEGFKSEQLDDVRQQTVKALESYIRGSYSGSEVKVSAGMNMSNSHSEANSQVTSFQNLQTKVQLSVAQTGGPPEAEGIVQWKSGLTASNETWSVIDRGLQLVPVWDIILLNHRNDFKDPLQVAKCLKENYTALTGLSAQIQDGEELLSAGKEVQLFLDDVKTWDVSEPEEKLRKLMKFMQEISQKTKSYNIWINTCLSDDDLQSFLIKIIDSYKKSPTYKTHFVKSQLRSLLDPHIYKVTSFPQAQAVMDWINQSQSEDQQIKITQFSEFIETLKDFKKDLMEIMVRAEMSETVEEAQRKATCKVTVALTSFLTHLQETEQEDMQLLLLSIAAGAGYEEMKNFFKNILECDELSFLLEEMQTTHCKYQDLNNICSYRAQAYLVLTALTTTQKVTSISPEEKSQRLALIRKHLEQSLSAQVAHVLTKYGSHHDWKLLEEDLRLLIDGDYEATTSSLQMDEVKKQLQSLCHKKKEPSEPKNNENYKEEVINNEHFLDLLQRLGLEHYYPKRMSRAKFHLIYNTSVSNTQPRSEQELPFYFLQKLLMLDYGLRYMVLKDDANTNNQISTGPTNQEIEDFDPFEELLEDSDNLTELTVTNSRTHIHPMDIQMAIFHCADEFARQYLLNKLSMCQFALPLLIPNPNNSQIEFPLWSFRGIRKSWQDVSKSPEDKSCSRSNQQMCRVSTPMVTFIRVGNGLSASKSQIMNSILSKRKHDVFFHRHCRGSSKHCILMGGVVEICWFCPGREDEDRFDKCVAFTNLHGDAKEHRQQLTFLQEVSSVLVVLMAASDHNGENQNLVRDLCLSSKPLICLLDDKEKALANNSGRRVRIGLRNRNEAELTEELTTTIRRLLELSDAAISLEDCSQIARKQGFLVDEDQRDCKEAREKAETVMALLKELQLSQIKEKLLPLQGQLWHLWCQRDKELYDLRQKGNRSIEQHKSEIETEKQKIRCQQLEKAFPLNDLMRSVLEILQDHSQTHNKLYFLQWLSVFLDNLTTEHVENLREKQRSLWSMVQGEKQKKQKSLSLKTWQNQMDAISRKILDCTLGIEQLLREVSQIYEALEEISCSRESLFLCLPQIAADLMIAGVPIELMDGDASYVPLKWVAAVFDKLAEKLGDKRLFVLSVLGLQSSGKSTLLNAIFGLQFTVSAGRCTKGAYMQLLKVEETFTGELGFDFVLVVDTEGLRAPELSNKSHNWDNELATFVIGLGNLTLINIFGENPSEMQDILQIAVQAFLRMKQVRISPSCLFVHQNVGEVTAKDQTMEGRQRLEQRLDEMTALAAKHEECPQITRFSDVIKFDVKNHIYYFAHLWDGNPPMAPPNPHYSHNVQELKSRILTTAPQAPRGSIMKISGVKFRIQDLWKALVSENFIFSFRNTREVVAMSQLETMYNQWTWELRSHLLDLQNQLTNQIQNGKMLTLTTSALEDPVTKKYETIQKDLEKYFKEDPDHEILIQWKSNFEHKLLILKDALISVTRRKANDLINLKGSQARLDKQKSQYDNELLQKSQKLALYLKHKELSDDQLQEKFNQLWASWVHDIASTAPKVIDPQIDVDSENILWEHFKKEKNLQEKLKKNSGEPFQINYDKHVQMDKNWRFSRKTLETHHKESIDDTTNKIISRFEETIKNIKRQQRDYDQNDFHEILKIIEMEAKSVRPEQEYTFTSKYIIDLSLCLFQRAAKTFKEMHQAFKLANDPVNYLESKRDDFFMSFKISCQGATSITSFVDFLWLKLTPAISATIWGKMGPKIAGEMRATCPQFNGNRANLEKHILISLAEEENFENYWQYIHCPESFFRNYILKHIRKYCSDKEGEKIQTFLKITLGDIKTAISTVIYESTAKATDKSSTASRWLDLFCEYLGDSLVFPRKDLISIEHQEINDTGFLREAMSIKLDAAMKQVEEDFSVKQWDELFPEIEKILSEHLCGCWKQCPFCKAICTNTIAEHDGDHSVLFHRSKAVIGWSWINTDHFDIDFCSTSVASDNDFTLPDNRSISYKNYWQAGGDYATWSITPDTSMQPYWKWFICHFRTHLETRYREKFTGRGTIPNAWTRITKKDVLDDLKK